MLVVQKARFFTAGSRLKTINNLLLVAIIGVNAYIVMSPFWQQVKFKFDTISQPGINLSNPESIPSIDRAKTHLVIPSLRFDEPVFVGLSQSLVNKGIWHRPASSTPDKGGNTVLAGHRFTYLGSAVFYNLDKLRVGDEMALVWNKKIYKYKVENIRTASPSDEEAESRTSDDRLTLFTCTPLWTAKNRLVIVSSLQEVL